MSLCTISWRFGRFERCGLISETDRPEGSAFRIKYALSGGAEWNELAVELLSAVFDPVLALAVVSAVLACLAKRRDNLNRKKN